MSKHDEIRLREHGGAVGTVMPVPRRINVAVSLPTLAAIDRVIDHEQVTLTEAVRRLVAYGGLVFTAVKEQEATVVLRDPDGVEREVIVL